jgi:hypothetical protein
VDTYADWLDARNNAREAIGDVEREGQRKAIAEAEYYRAKAVCVARMKAEGHAATIITAMVKGDEEVNAKLQTFRMAEARYKAAQYAANLFIDEEAHTYDQHKRALSGDSERF